MTGGSPTLAQRLEAALVGSVFRILRWLGPVRASNLGGRVARRIGPWLPVSRVALRNIRLAFPTLDDAAVQRILRGAWENLGRTACELPHLPDLAETPDGPGWEVSGAVAGFTNAGGPRLFFSGHLANWEVLMPAAHARGTPAGLFYRAAGNPLVDRLITDLRRRTLPLPAPMLSKGAAGARGALAHLARGGSLAMLMDQKMNDGIPAQFFGHTAMTAPALAALALRFRCPVLPAYVVRLGPARFRVVCEPPLPLPDTGNRSADTAALTQAVNDRLEAWIRARPDSWLWMHRRWPKDAATPGAARSAGAPRSRR